jgi:acyl-CoA thioesterase YciA
MSMKYFTRKMIAHKDLNSNGTLFGGRVLDWIDEEAYIYCSCQLDNDRVVTRSMSNIDFLHSAVRGDIIEIGMETVKLGITSITIKCNVRNKRTEKTITSVDKIVFVNLGPDGKPAPHGVTNES